MDYTFGLFVILIFLLIITVSKINTLESRIKRMKFTIDQITTQVDIPEHPVNEKLRILVKEGKEVKAVKEARVALGLSLLEAKKYVDAL